MMSSSSALEAPEMSHRQVLEALSGLRRTLEA
jgi:hypothetical protein